jgi:hypothetical protein
MQYQKVVESWMICWVVKVWPMYVARVRECRRTTLGVIGWQKGRLQHNGRVVGMN